MSVMKVTKFFPQFQYMQILMDLFDVNTYELQTNFKQCNYDTILAKYSGS